MPEQKTKPTNVSVKDFLLTVEDEKIRKDCLALTKIFSKASGYPAKMWGGSIVGFGSYHYKYSSGHEGDSCLSGFAPRTGKISLYIMGAVRDQPKLLEKLGKHKASKGCIYVKKLEDLDQKVLEELITKSVDVMKSRYPDPAK